MVSEQELKSLSDEDLEKLKDIAKAAWSKAVQADEPAEVMQTKYAIVTSYVNESRLRKNKGRKFDQGKWRFSLLPWQAILEVIKVLEFGATKYEVDNWKHVPEARDRYFNATMRHIMAWFEGEQKDQETGFNHLAHAVCCLLFLISFDKQEKE